MKVLRLFETCYIVNYVPSQSFTMSYPVFIISCIGAPRDHHAIFVEMKSGKTGQIFQVTGKMQSGMQYESKSGERPEDSASSIKNFDMYQGMNRPTCSSRRRNVHKQKWPANTPSSLVTSPQTPN